MSERTMEKRERNLDILRLRLQGKTNVDIAERHGITVPRVAQILARFLKEAQNE